MSILNTHGNKLNFYELQVCYRDIYISSLGDDVLFDPNQCIYMLNKILLKLSLGDSND